VNDTASAVPVPSASRPATPRPLAVSLTPDEERLLAHLDGTPCHLDIVTEASGLSAAQAAVAVTLLEMKSLIERHPGNLFARTP
jgi:hypothetical protein